MGKSLALSCPAQGFPLPAFRLVQPLTYVLKSMYLFIMCNIEPIGGAKPKFSMVAKGLQIVHGSKNSITLSCPAQGFPLPAFRLEYGHFWFLKYFLDFRTNWWDKAKIFIVLRDFNLDEKGRDSCKSFMSGTSVTTSFFQVRFLFKINLEQRLVQTYSYGSLSVLQIR